MNGADLIFYGCAVLLIWGTYRWEVRRGQKSGDS